MQSFSAETLTAKKLLFIFACQSFVVFSVWAQQETLVPGVELEKNSVAITYLQAFSKSGAYSS